MSHLSVKQTLNLADEAFLEAAYEVVERAIATGTPVLASENGEVKRLDPRTIKLPPRKKKKAKQKLKQEKS